MTQTQLRQEILPVFSHGFLILDKPTGISSAQAVAKVKHLLQCKKIGHGGTLDPLASGILPLAIGEATKAFDYVASSTKEYLFTITFGEERATADAEGEVTATTTVIPSKEDILKVLPEFTGHIMQTPPIYSALKINGKPAYALARAGKEVEMTARPVEIHALELLSVSMEERSDDPAGEISRSEIGDSVPPMNNYRGASATTPHSEGVSVSEGGESLLQVTFSVTCGKGTYVRSLAQDIARKCNSLGYISTLRRVSVGKFHENNAISLDKLPELVHNAALLKAWVPIELALDDIPAIDMNPDQAIALRHGKTLLMDKRDGEYVALSQGHIVALAEVRGGVLRSKRIFNTNE